MYLDQLNTQIEIAFLHFMQFGLSDERTQRLVCGVFEIWKEHNPEWIRAYTEFEELLKNEHVRPA